MNTGIVKFFNDSKGFGFIKDEALHRNFEKKNMRDGNRHQQNEKLK